MDTEILNLILAELKELNSNIEHLVHFQSTAGGGSTLTYDPKYHILVKGKFKPATRAYRSSEGRVSNGNIYYTSCPADPKKSMAWDCGLRNIVEYPAVMPKFAGLVQLCQDPDCSRLASLGHKLCTGCTMIQEKYGGSQRRQIQKSFEEEADICAANGHVPEPRPTKKLKPPIDDDDFNPFISRSRGLFPE